MALTVDLRNSVRKDLLLHFLVLQALEHVGNDRLCELGLLVLLLLLLEAHPAVQNGLYLRRKRNLLLLDECLRLKLRGLLDCRTNIVSTYMGMGSRTYWHTLESANRFSVTDTTSFICSTDAMRSLTACVCSARDELRIPLIRLM